MTGIAEVFHARISDYSYPAHAHDTWTVLIVDSGAIRYDLESRECGAVGQTVAILPPGIIHNGQAARGAPGFVKRVLYLDQAFLPIELVGAAVDRTNIEDVQLRQALVGIHESLVLGEEPLDSETRLSMVRERLVSHLHPRLAPECAEQTDRGLAGRLRRLLDESRNRSLTLDEAAQTLERSKPHMIRCFTNEFGVSPHAYVVASRIEAARPRLLNGEPLAEVATAVGFYDQAHFTRHFKRHTSVTPGRFVASYTNQSGGRSAPNH